jgi:xylulokinase
VRADALALVGGGARSATWARLIATAIGAPLVVPEGAELAAPAGAARLARVAAAGGDTAPLAQPKPVRAEVEPDPALAERLAPRRDAFDRLIAATVDPAGRDGLSAG